MCIMIQINSTPVFARPPPPEPHSYRLQMFKVYSIYAIFLPLDNTSGTAYYPKVVMSSPERREEEQTQKQNSQQQQQQNQQQPPPPSSRSLLDPLIPDDIRCHTAYEELAQTVSHYKGWGAFYYASLCYFFAKQCKPLLLCIRSVYFLHDTLDSTFIIR